MSKNTDVVQQLKQWVDELQQVRNDFAVGLKASVYDDFERILKEMQEFIASTKQE